VRHTHHAEDDATGTKEFPADADQPKVSQISPPIRIVLVAAVVFLAAWFTVLKPSDEVVPPEPTAAPATGPQSSAARFRAKAQAGKATAEADATGAANATIEGDAPTAAPTAAAPSAPSASATATRPSTTAAAPAAPTAPVPEKAIAKLPRDVRVALAEHKVVVLGVLDTAGKPWAPASDDDRLVRSALRGVNRYGGKVVVEPISIGRLIRYDGIPEALGVTQSPTVVIIDRNRHATALTGYQDRISIDQVIADARRVSTTTQIRDTYLSKVNASCAQYGMRLDRFSLASAGGSGGAIRRLLTVAGKERRSIARIAAPAKWRGLKAQMLRVRAVQITGARRAYRLVRRGKVASATTALETNSAEFAALDRRFNAVGLTACASNRTR
jgi:hypothetical protein